MAGRAEVLELLDYLKRQVETLPFDEPCSPAETKLANAMAVLIGIVHHHINASAQRETERG